MMHTRHAADCIAVHQVACLGRHCLSTCLMHDADPHLMVTQTRCLRAALQGYLIPQYHIFYWAGLKLDGYWPNFVWMDPNILGPTGYYEHWGTDASNVLEPNDMQVGCSQAALWRWWCAVLPSDVTCTRLSRHVLQASS